MSVVEKDVFSTLESVVMQGDLSKLSASDRVTYYQRVCSSLGLNPLTKPFDYLTLNGKLMLYARKDATEQLRKIHGISLKISSRELVDDVYVVTAQATDKAGRTDESIGAINLAGLKGDAKANAMMKCETKAKRRVTLSIAGLGMLDESEVSSVPDAKILNNEMDVDMDTGEVVIDNEKNKLCDEIRKIIKVSNADTKRIQEEIIERGASRLNDLSISSLISIKNRLIQDTMEQL